MDLVQQMTKLELTDELHEARLLVLLSAFCDAKDGTLEGMTKLAKLDFLLRYPVWLERALVAKGKPVAGVGTTDAERSSVESKMVRYRFGPWDHRYRRWLNDLAAKGLVVSGARGKAVVIDLTDAGRVLAEQLSATPEFELTARRSRILKAHFDVRATTLMRFIYSTFPEITTLRMNEKIG
jgi:hypothetical protein